MNQSRDREGKEKEVTRRQKYEDRQTHTTDRGLQTDRRANERKVRQRDGR